MGRAAESVDWYIDSMPGERTAAWWLSVGRSPEQVVADLVAQVRLDEAAAWVAVERAGGLASVRPCARDRQGVL